MRTIKLRPLFSLWIMLALLTGVPSIAAQSDAIITAENVDRLTQVGMIGQSWAYADVAWSPDGTQIAVVSQAGGLLFQSNDLTQAPHVFSIDRWGEAQSIGFSPDARRLVVGYFAVPSFFIVWDVQTGEQLAIVSGNEGTKNDIYNPQFSPDGTYLVTSKSDGERLTLWDGETFDVLYQTDVTSSAYAVRGDSQVIAYRIGEALFLYNVAENAAEAISGFTLDQNLHQLLFTPDGALLAFTSAETDRDTVEVWDVFANRIVREIPSPFGIFGVRTEMSVDGDFAVGGWGRAAFWTTNARAAEVLYFADGLATVDGLAFSPDGSRLITIANSRTDGSLFTPPATLALWDVATLRAGQTQPLQQFTYNGYAREAALGEQGLLSFGGALWNIETFERFQFPLPPEASELTVTSEDQALQRVITRTMPPTHTYGSS